MTSQYGSWDDAERRLRLAQEEIDAERAERKSADAGAERIRQDSLRFVQPINDIVQQFIDQMDRYRHDMLERFAMSTGSLLCLQTAFGEVSVGGGGGAVSWGCRYGLWSRDDLPGCDGSHKLHVSTSGVWFFECVGEVANWCVFHTVFGYRADESGVRLTLSAFELVRNGTVVGVVRDRLAAIMLAYGVPLPPD